VGTTIYLFGGLVAGGEYDGTFSTTVQSFDVATRWCGAESRGDPVNGKHAGAIVETALLSLWSLPSVSTVDPGQRVL
jgi:hypothetical protein